MMVNDKITQRRNYIRNMIEQGKEVDTRALAKIFDSSPVAIKNDLSTIISGSPAYKKKLTTGQNTRARKLNVVGLLNESEWGKVLRRHGYKCAICGNLENLSIDHIVPVSKGGTNTRDNIQPLCKSCNSRKGNRV